ncbi:hypothetical protein EYF80_041201 [Liparis tanakae]|uniref:Uncharacterized protein n=1 Tax=Liparis tanakae TaxID=230148 RepID=A0A4Z2G737_9TELE|nr:hypothetical protein EYF80_041201 [Liparis tanakae]
MFSQTCRQFSRSRQLCSKPSTDTVPRQVLVLLVLVLVFNVWLSSHIWLFRLVPSQLIEQLINTLYRQRVSAAAASRSAAACHSVCTRLVAEQIKSHLRACTGTI